MLFNSYTFLFLFLPITLVGCQIVSRFSRRGVIVWLGLVSLAFYAYWRPALLMLLLSSIAINYLAGELISRRIPTPISSRVWLISAIAINLSVLCYFKYLFPSLNFFSSAIGSSKHWAGVVLPLGISFFTFTQIAFLVDLYQGIATQQDISSYVLFVTFFPHLIAGPILHHKDMMPQFQQKRSYSLNLSDLAMGFSWFVMGLAKKVLLADNFSRIADPVFGAHSVLTARSAWEGALAYCLQLYFDFSGYSDMALGLARMFSIDFPLNFNSPFKATSIIDFWQRWHITLSNYIMSYLYTPLQMWARARRQAKGLGVSRKDTMTAGGFTSLIALPMMTTLFIAGVWHGAGFQFMIYGLLHGFYLTVNHSWRLIFHKKNPTSSQPLFIRYAKQASSVLLTFICVMISFVFFRSHGTNHALSILTSMLGSHNLIASTLTTGSKLDVAKIVLGLGIVWFLPNTQQILSRFKPSLQETIWISPKLPKIFLWKPTIAWGLIVGLIFLDVLCNMQDTSTFLYFQF